MQRSPVYEKTRGVETNKCSVGWNILIGSGAAFLWGAISLVACIVLSNTPQIIKVTILVTALLLLDRAVWMICHACNKSTVTDAPDAHGFERNSLFLVSLIFLVNGSYKGFSDGKCEPEPITGTIQNNGMEFIVENTGKNVLGACELIQNNTSATLMWALCTAPILLLFGTGWKALKATRKSDKKEVVWLPSLGIIDLLCCIAQSLKWLFSRMVPILIILIVAIVVLLAVAVLHCLQWLSKLLRRLRSQFH